MAYRVLTMENPSTGQQRRAPLGFSWTCLFFGPFVPATRRDWSWTFIWLGLAIVTGSVAHWVLPFLYNKIYARNLVLDGFIVPELGNAHLNDFSNRIGAPVRNI